MKKNILFALCSNIVTAFSAWLMLWYLIRYGQTEDVGLYGLVQAIALPLYMFLTFKLRTIQVTDSEKKYSNNDYLIARLILASLNIIISVVFFNIFYNSEVVLAIVALSFGYSLAIVKEYYISLMQISERNDLYFISNLFQSIFGLILFVLTYYLTSNIIYSIAVYSLSRLPCLFFDKKITSYIDDFSYRINFKKNIVNVDGVKKLFKIGMPLGVTAVIGATFTSIPRIILEKKVNLEALGIFTTLMSLVVAVNLFMSSFTQVVLPRLSMLYRVNRVEFNKMNTIFFFVMLVISFFTLLFVYIYSKDILLIVFGEKYTFYYIEFFYCMVSATLLAIFHYCNMLLNAIRYFEKQMYIYGLSALSCLLSSLFLIPVYKLDGAIYASMICSCVGIMLSMAMFFYKTKGIVHEFN